MAITTMAHDVSNGRRKLAPVAVAVVLVAVASVALAIGPVRGSTTSGADPDVVELPDARIAIELFERRLAANPVSGIDALVLGQLYLDLGRQTGQDDEFLAGEERLTAAVDLLPESVGAKASLGSAYASRHRFAESAAIGDELLATDPRSTEGLMLVGDAAMAVGEYDRARVAYDTLLSLDRTPRELTRAAHLAEVTGDLGGAVALMGEAIVLAERSTYAGEPLAWLYWRYGELHLHQGITEPAVDNFEGSLQALPEFPLALNGLADIAFRQERMADAEALYERSLDSAPSTDALLGLAYVLRAQDRDAEAQQRIDEAIALVTPASEDERVLYDRDLALVLADLDQGTDEAVERAEFDLAKRPDVFGYDVYAWTLYRAGRYDEARTASDAALATGMQEPDFLYHSSLIWDALGDSGRAEADFAAARAIDPSMAWVSQVGS